MSVLDSVVPPHCFACYVCAGCCSATPLRCLVCMCHLVWCHHFVLPAICVLVALAPPYYVACYVCAGWCGATTLCCPLCVCWLVWCLPPVVPAMCVLVGVESRPIAACCVPPTCFAYCVCAGCCGATPLSCLLCICWLVCLRPLLLPAMYVIDCVMPRHCVASYACAG